MKLIDKLDGRCGNYEVTPEDARRLLDDERAKNRPIRTALVARYLRRMKESLWRLNGQAIILSSDGRLLDGQHRLEAIANLGKSMVCTVLYGDFDFKTMDEGTPRDGRDLLAIVTNHQNLIVVQAATRLLIKHERAMAREASMFSNTKALNDGDWNDISNQEILAFVKRNPSVVDIVTHARNAAGKGRSLVAISPAVAAWFLVARKESAEKAAAFFVPLLSGADLTPTDPRLALRRNLQNARDTGTKPGSLTVFALICKTYAQQGRAVKIMSFKTGENFAFIR